MYKKNIWEIADNQKVEAIMEFNKPYIEFLSHGKTERECVKQSVALAEKAGFKPLDSFDSLHTGDRVYVLNKNKNIALFIIGKKGLRAGMRVLGAHIDSPRIDLKQNPLYEKDGFALLDTHYYGGIKKYQWVTIPLALHGVICKKDGTTVEVNVGEDPEDPVLGIGDLLIHLSQDQLTKVAAKVIEGENLDVTIGSIPLKKEEEFSVKANILRILKEKYDMEEDDFVSTEIEVVPAGRAREYGLDRSMVAGYGQDDRVCAYTSLRAILDIKEVPEYTSCCILVDKEEIGSVGATGAHSLFFENTVARLLEKMGETSFIATREAMENSYMLSSDVSAGVDPLFESVNEMKNAAFLGQGVVFNKYTGSRGKSGCNDTNPEFIAWLRKVLDEEQVHYQTAELGRVDAGGGGTIAYILGNYNMNVIDAGVAVLNMHAPMEISSKADVYEAYLSYIAFLTK